MIVDRSLLRANTLHGIPQIKRSKTFKSQCGLERSKSDMSTQNAACGHPRATLIDNDKMSNKKKVKILLYFIVPQVFFYHLKIVKHLMNNHGIIME